MFYLILNLKENVECVVKISSPLKHEGPLWFVYKSNAKSGGDLLDATSSTLQLRSSSDHKLSETLNQAIAKAKL